MNIPATCLGTIESSCTLPELNESMVRSALKEPIWQSGQGPTVFDSIKPGESTCFIVSDYTRKTATNRVFPVILRGLTEKGCSPDNVSVLVASGIHRPPTRDEINNILGKDTAELLRDRIFLHDPDDDTILVDVGTTKRGNKVRINKHALETDRLVLIGAATYHYHAGFGGGRKSLVPGIASRDTIASSHSLTLDPDNDRIHSQAEIGVMDGNPVSEEMMESARMCNPTMIVNTVLNPDGKLVGLFTGDLDLAHRKACDLVEQVCRVNIDKPADFVIASAGDAPNWIQSHKALYNASRAVKDGGRIILTAACPEGLGNERFRYWVRKDIVEIFTELRQSPEILGQTALSTKTRGKHAILVTKLPGKDRADLGIATAPDEASAIQMVLADSKLVQPKAGSEITYYLMPSARYTVPFHSQTA